MANDPNYYHTVHLKDFPTVEEATNIVKSIVPPDLARYVTVDLVRPVYHDPKKREYRLSTLVNFFSNKAKAQKEIESLESWTGVLVGGRDIRKFDQPVEQVKGQNHLMVMDSGDIRSFSAWGTTIGPRGASIQAPTLQRATVKVAPREFKFSSGETGLGYDGKLVVESVDIPESELAKFLAERAMSIDLLTTDMKYQPVLLRGKIGLVMPLENWVDSDDLIPVTDKQGNIIYERDENNQLRTDVHGNPIPRMKRKRVPDGIGQPPIQLKAHGENVEQYVMKITLYDDDDDSGNRVSAQLQRTKFGDRHLLITDADLMVRDAAAAPMGGSEDGWAMLTNMWRGTEVVVAGTVISVNERESDGQSSVWYGIDATLIISTDGIITQGQAATATPEMPTIVAQTAPEPAPTPPVAPAYDPAAAIASDQPAKTEMSYPSGIAPTTPAPVEAPAPAPTPAPIPAPAPVAQPTPQPAAVGGGFEQLTDAINTVFDAMGLDTSYDALMASSFKNIVPATFHETHQRPVVEAFMDKVRNDRRAAATPASAPAPAPAPTPPAPAPAPTTTAPAQTQEEAIKSALAAQQGQAPTDVVAVVASSTTTPPTDGVKCGKCGKILTDDEIMSHVC